MKTCLGIESGSTRIKAVTVDRAYRPVSSGDYARAGVSGSTVQPDAALAEGFRKYIQRYQALLQVERAAVEHL